MLAPAASWPSTALTVTRVSRMRGRPRIRFGSTVIRSWAIGQGYLAARPLPRLRDPCKAESAEIGANPHASMPFQALVPEMEAICGDGLILFRRPAPEQPAHMQGIHEKAADGIRTHDLLHGNYAGRQRKVALHSVDLQGFHDRLARALPA